VNTIEVAVYDADRNRIWHSDKIAIDDGVNEVPLEDQPIIPAGGILLWRFNDNQPVVVQFKEGMRIETLNLG
jgi:hypothetical protein